MHLKPVIKRLIFRGVVSVSISLNNFDLKQCGDDEENEINDELTSTIDANYENMGLKNRTIKTNRNHGPFYGTDDCDHVSTQVKLKDKISISIL